MNEELMRLQAVVDQALRQRTSLRVLEAGCGSTSRIRLGPKALIVGLDRSITQLNRNTAVHQKVVGDVQRPMFRSAVFDAIICWDVLEHLPHPERALGHFVDALKEEGLLILAFPNVFSLKGLITKWTPHWLHIFAYRVLFGDRQAGTDDRAPFPTFLRWSMAPATIKRFAQAHGLSVVYERLYERPRHQRLRASVGLVNGRWEALTRTMRVLSLGRIHTELMDCLLVLKKDNVAHD